MADYRVRDSEGNTVGYISEATGAGCAGCLGLAIIAVVIYGGINFYRFMQARIANNKIEAQRVVLNSDTLDTYAGEYNYARYKIKVERRGSKLFSISPEEFCELMPVSTQEFIYFRCVLGFQGRARFEQDGRGKMALIVIHQDGRTERVSKVN
ncbi:MAG: hypothetical protein H0T60_04125 [Acidobacteria bacterium]|nr:hypothetical protein [Acidobacteriota bacterium]